MRFPVSGTSFFHYAHRLGLEERPVPEPADRGGRHHRYRHRRPDLLRRDPRGPAVGALAGRERLEPGARGDRLLRPAERDQGPRRRRVEAAVGRAGAAVGWPHLLRLHRHLAGVLHAAVLLSGDFGLVGFGTGGWDSDFPNSMLEILRVVLTNCDTDQELIVGGVEQLPRGLWTLPVSDRSSGSRPAPRSPACTAASRGPASRPSTGTPTAPTSPCGTDGAPAGLIRPSLRPARAGSSRPRSTATRASSRISCGWRSTGPATCRRPRRS